MRCFFVLLLGEQLTSRTRCMNSWWPRSKGLRMCWEVPNDLVIGESVELHSLCPVDIPLWRSPKFLSWHFETKATDHYVNMDVCFSCISFLGGNISPILLFKMMILWPNIWTSATNSNWIPLIHTEQSIIPLELGTPPLRRIDGRKIQSPHVIGLDRGNPSLRTYKRDP